MNSRSKRWSGRGCKKGQCGRKDNDEGKREKTQASTAEELEREAT